MSTELEPTEWKPFLGSGEDAPAKVRFERRQIGGTVSRRPVWAWEDGRTREGYWMPEFQPRAAL